MSGLEPYGRSTALEFLFSPISGAHIALLSTLPVDGLGAVEINPAGYARQPCSSWSTTSITGLPSVTSRCNASAITFGPFASDVDAKGWAVYDALAAGNLIASGSFVDAGFNQAGVITIPAGDDIQFQIGDLCLSLSQDCPIVVSSLGDTCSIITGITVSDSGSPPVSWNIGDTPILVATSAPITVVITLAAPSTDMAGFVATITNASPGPFIPGASSFTVVYASSPIPSTSSSVTVENLSLTPVCAYSLGVITQTL